MNIGTLSIALFVFFQTVGLTNSEVIYAVNCGGPRYYSEAEGILYLEDNGYNGGVNTDSGKNLSPFPLVEDDIVYHTERYTMEKSLQYMVKLENLNPGKFTIVLKFSEIHFREVGKKTFSISIGNVLFKQKLDIFKEVGYGVPLEEYVECEYDGNKITLNGIEVTQGFSKKEMLLIVALFKQEDNPKINAIVVYQGPASQVPKIEKPQPTISIEDILMKINKEGQKPNIMDNPVYVINEPAVKKINLSVTESVINISTTIPGLAILTVLSIATLRISMIILNKE
ncbi:transmembrane protein [Cryptosporidium ryanae]|uniref:uncharacterized protein n=1 Tax=Cryptosporidium ryanae TaxID=515981 RepID=UPI00351A56A0|nr:transmembrane protein [Cryptosporidium ryanae]